MVFLVNGPKASEWCINSISHHSKEDKGERIIAYLWIKLIQGRNGCFYIPDMDSMLYFLSSLDVWVFPLWLQVGFFRKIGCGLGISLHHKVVKDESIDVAGYMLC